MLYADEIRRQVEVAPRAALPAVTSAMWKAFGDGHLTEAEAEALSSLIEARQQARDKHPGGQTPNPTGTGAARLTDTAQARQNSPRTGVGSRPRTDMPALSAAAAGRPPGGFLPPSPRGSPRPSRPLSASWLLRLPGAGIAGCPSPTWRLW